MKTRNLITFIAVVAILFLSFPKAWSQETNPQPRNIKVQGEGRVAAVPDQAELEIEVSEEDSEAETASALAKAKMEKVFQTVKSFGVQDKDIQTVSYSVRPKMTFDNGEAKKDGYTVSNRIKILVKNLDSAGKILVAVIKAGATNVDGPNFTFSDPDKLKIDALKAAVLDARAKADAMAQSAGVVLGDVYSVAQLGLNMPNPRQRFGQGFTDVVETASVQQAPIATGQDEVVAQVEVVYSLK